MLPPHEQAFPYLLDRWKTHDALLALEIHVALTAAGVDATFDGDQKIGIYHEIKDRNYAGAYDAIASRLHRISDELEAYLNEWVPLEPPLFPPEQTRACLKKQITAGLKKGKAELARFANRHGLHAG